MPPLSRGRGAGPSAGPDRRAACALPVTLLLAAVWLFGLAHLAVLPPWEGFDEPAHYAFIEEMAARRTAPDAADARLSAAVEASFAVLPRPYTVPATDANPVLTLAQVLNDPGRRQAAAEFLQRPQEAPFRPGRTENGEALMHPPLYYALLAPLYRAAQGLGWQTRLMLLRAASYALAVAGLAVAAAAMFRWGAAAGIARPGAAALAVAGWPLLVPQYLPQFARLGNDSLCALLFGLALALLLRIEARGLSLPAAGALGLVLGLGALTKALMPPVAIGIGLWLLWRGRRAASARHFAAALALATALAFLAGGWWWVVRIATQDSLTGSIEFRALAAQGGLAASLPDRITAAALLRGVAAMVASFVWAGTHSLARLPEWLLALPVAAACLPLLAALPPRRPVDWLPWACLAPLAAGLLYHLCLRIALTGQGIGTPGWYLHILAPALALAAARGLGRIAGWSPALLLSLFGATLLYQAAALLMQLALFAGCAVRGGDKRYAFPDGMACLGDPAGLYADLAVLGRPDLAIAAFAAGLALALAAFAVLSRRSIPAARYAHG